MTDSIVNAGEAWMANEIAQLREEKEAAGAERDRLADRVAELEGEFHALEGRRLAARSDAEGWKSLHEEASARLQRAEEALRTVKDGKSVPLWAAMLCEDALAALAGEDDGPPKPQREGDYL